MKNLFIILILLCSLTSYSQVTNTENLRVVNATTQFGKNVSVGNQIYNIQTGELWVVTNAIISTETIISASAFLELINPVSINNAHEADPLFSNWNKRDGINIFSKQIIDKKSILEPYAFLTDITDGTIDADFTSVSINGNNIITILGDTALQIRNDIPEYLTDLDSTGFRITESQISDLDYFTNTDETDPVYATDSANIVWFSDLTDSLNIVRDSLAIHLDTLQAHNTKINTNVDSLISHNTRINNNLDSINIHRPLIDANTLKITFPGFSTLLDDYSFTDNSTLWDNTADSIPILRADIDDINAKLDTIEVFYAASSQTDYTLANNVQQEYTISQNGVILPPSVYSLSTNILTINIGVYKNDRIQINYKYIKL